MHLLDVETIITAGPLANVFWVFTDPLPLLFAPGATTVFITEFAKNGVAGAAMLTITDLGYITASPLTPPVAVINGDAVVLGSAYLTYF